MPVSLTPPAPPVLPMDKTGGLTPMFVLYTAVSRAVKAHLARKPCPEDGEG
jgi:hypothetical protein